MASGKVKVGIIGSGFEADIHAASFQLMPEEAEVVAVASPTPENASKLAKSTRFRAFFAIIARCCANPISRW
jgi:predicted dehydrogenase